MFLIFKYSVYVFLETVEQGSFSGAAKKLWMSQSAVSLQIKKLEEELGFVLFDRASYRPTLTEAGTAFYEICKQMVAEYEDKRREILFKEKEKENIITVGITGPYENRYVPDVVREFSRTHPVKILIKFCNFQECVDWLEDGRLDVAFGLENDYRGHNNLEYHTICMSHCCIAVNRDNPLSERDSIHVWEIGNEPIVAMSEKMGKRFSEDFRSGFANENVTPNIVAEYDTFEEMLMAVRTNVGIAFLSNEVLSEDESIKAVDILDPTVAVKYVIGINIHNKKNHLREFYDYTIRFFREIETE